ncbi:MAG TPA: family 1 glycosylhydrolase [Acidimicrobiales bacterium]|nr:family 1 glycosylhydrolase [Acidimicrobiales bacterium]
MPEVSFPDGFRWGTATAAHQIEGGCWNNDWWRWEHTPGSGCVESSGDACDSWNRWPDDVALLAELGFDSYRFSIEWSRIEPEDGEHAVAALDHYLRLGEALLEAGIEPVVTFHHFTTPRWLADGGGWTNPATADRFAAFCERAATHLAPVLRRACTINEPNIVATMGYLVGVFPPGVRDRDARHRANEVFVAAHRGAVDAIRAAAPGVPVGLTLSMDDYQAVDGGESKRDHIRRGMEDVFLDATEGDDFVGVQTYSRSRIGPDGRLPGEEGVPTLIMGYEYYPQALEATIRRAWDRTKGEVPILVTENGIGTDDDAQRQAYVRSALEGVLRCLADGIDVRGYTYWSLLDNFEWAFGYGPRFGLVDCDRTTFARTPKDSARWLGRVARANALVD